MSSSSSVRIPVASSGPPKTALEAAERFKQDSMRIARIFSTAAKEMNPSPLSDLRIFLLTQADTVVQGKDAVESVELFITRITEVHTKRPKAVAAYKNRDISFVTSNEDVLIPAEAMRGIISECLARRRPDGRKYFDDSVIETVWMSLKNLIVKANNYVKLSPEKYPDSDIIKRVWY
jgi:hypothetical protein